MLPPSLPPETILLDLSDDLLSAILQKLKGTDLARENLNSLTQVCTRLSALCKSATLWRAACLKTPGFPHAQYALAHPPQKIAADFWRLCYRQFYLHAHIAVCPGCLQVSHDASEHRDPAVVPMCFYVRNATARRLRSTNDGHSSPLKILV